MSITGHGRLFDLSKPHRASMTNEGGVDQGSPAALRGDAVPPRTASPIMIDGAGDQAWRDTCGHPPNSSASRSSSATTPPRPGRGACRQSIVEVEGQRKPMAVLHHHPHRRHGGTDAAHLARRREGPRHGVMELAAHQPPAGLPGLRQGRRVPAAEPGDDATATPTRASRARSAPSPKPVPISTQVLLDRERCVLCARCTRFSNQIAGDPMIELLERGALQQVGTGEGDPFESYFSGNTIQICPVGALTCGGLPVPLPPVRPGLARRRVCEHCSGGCAIRTDHRRGKVMRAPRRRTTPRSTRSGSATRTASAFRLRRTATTGSPPAGPQRGRRAGAGLLARGAPASPRQACARAGPAPRRPDRRAAHRRGRLRLQQVRAGRRSTPTTSTSARAPHSAEEARLPAHVAGRAATWGTSRTSGVAPASRPSLETGARGRCWSASRPRRRRPASSCGCARPAAGTAQKVVLAGHRYATRGLDEGGRHPAAGRARHRDRVAGRPASGVGLDEGGAQAGRGALRAEGAVILVGERLAAVPGALTSRRADRRRRPAPGWPGSRAGPVSAARSRPARCRRCCPAAGRSTDPRARESRSPPRESGATLPRRSGRDTGEIARRPRPGASSQALLVGGRGGRRPARPRAARVRRSTTAGFVVSAGAAAQRGHRARRRGAARRRRSPRRPAPSSTGRAGCASSRPRSSPTR